MKLHPLAIGCLILAAAPGFGQEQPEEPEEAAPPRPKLESRVEKASYSFGYDIGRSIVRSMRGGSLNVDPSLVAEGIYDAMKGREALLPEDELRMARRFVTQRAGPGGQGREEGARMAERANVERGRRAQVANENQDAGQEFLRANRDKEGVEVLPGGLQYKVIETGDGLSPGPGDRITAHYRGRLVNGDEFDSSYDRGEPLVFTLDQVIPGWSEALRRMKVGDKWELFIPPHLAYGEEGRGDRIGPNEVLIFEIELLGVEKQQQTPDNP